MNKSAKKALEYANEGGRALGFQDSENLVTGDESDLRDAM
jgi:hypothetical protein